VDITEPCLDAEALAAWVDGGLSPSEQSRAEAHVADCARCQALLGTMTRITPAPADARIVPAPRRWLPWAVPLAAAAAAVILWVSIPRSELHDLQPPPMASAQATRPEQPGEVVSPLQSPSASLSTSSAPAPPPRPVEPPPAAELRKEAGVPADPVASPPPPAADATASNAVAARSAFADNAASRDIVSPDPMVRWRVAGSDVQHSVDGGGSWTTTPTGVTTTLLAGAAPSPTVVWIVGLDGAVLLSTDGRTWQRLPFPENVDLVSVRARDARAATLTARDGRKFSTADAGGTWVPGDLQGF
jgi:hypothetical protein